MDEQVQDPQGPKEQTSKEVEEPDQPEELKESHQPEHAAGDGASAVDSAAPATAPASGAAPWRRRGAMVAIGAGVLAAGVGIGFTVSHGRHGAGGPPAPAALRTARAGGMALPGGPGGAGLRGPGGRLGQGPLGAADAIHGELVTKAADGSYPTTVTQTGEVTAVTSSSISVRSEDGFTRTYSVEAGTTRVNAGNGSIEDIAKGASVRVTAKLDGRTAQATTVADLAAMQNLRGRMPGSQMPGATGPGDQMPDGHTNPR